MSNDMFKDIENELQGVQEQEDRLGGGGYLVESGVYEAKVKMAYITTAASSAAKAMNLVLEVDGKELRERIWMTNKLGKPTYEKEKKKFMLPGYEAVNDLCLVTTGHPFSEQEIVNKTIKVYDFEQKAEVEKNLPVVKSILTLPLYAAVLLVRENKTAKDDAGDYVDTAETRDFNECDKFFHIKTKKTVVELKRGGDIKEEDMFISLWSEKNKGQLRDRSKKIAGQAPAGSAAAKGGSTTKSLFAD
jgi:hypothetical protein